MSVIETAFKKLLGRGRAWITPAGFTSDILALFVSPFEELKTEFENLTKIHFPTMTLDESAVVNNETLFGITNTTSKTIVERAEETERNWRLIAGSSTWLSVENALIQAGYNVKIVENTQNDTLALGQGINYNTSEYGRINDGKTAQYGGFSSTRVIGNGRLQLETRINDPAQISDGKSSFYLELYFTPSDSDWETITDILLRMKPAHTAAICLIKERKLADNEEVETEIFADVLDGGEAETINFGEEINPNEEAG